MKVFGITGGVGAGKSEVLTYLGQNYDATVIQADEAGYLVMLPGGECYGEIVKLFGRQITTETGELDRKRIAEIVFQAGCEQRLDHTDTIFPGTASGGRNLPFRFRPVLAGRFDKMEVVLASAGIHIGIAGVLFLCALVMGLDIADFRPLVFCKSHNRILCFFHAQSLRFCQTMS